MIVVADTSPLNYLALIGEAQLLHQLYGRVLVPQAVAQELLHPAAPAIVSEWIRHRPAWLDVVEVKGEDPSLANLDPGEREALILAQKLSPDGCF